MLTMLFIIIVPNVPKVHVIPLYSHLTNQLSSLMIELYEVVSLMVIILSDSLSAWVGVCVYVQGGNAICIIITVHQ